MTPSRQAALAARGLRPGSVKGCGGRSRDPLFASWYGAIVRCEVAHHASFPWYGGKGVEVCDRWRFSFAAFCEDMGDRPAGAQLDRIDPAGHYEPANCRWLDRGKNVARATARPTGGFPSVTAYAAAQGLTVSGLYQRSLTGSRELRLRPERVAQLAARGLLPGQISGCGVVKAHPLAGVFRAMVDRCERPGWSSFPWYGGKGVEVCDRWRFSFAAFCEDMGDRPAGAQLDRIDAAGHYEPANCRWLDRGKNSARARAVPFGEFPSASAAARALGVSAGALRLRRRLGQSPGGIIAAVRARSVRGGAVVSAGTLHYRRKHGWCDACARSVPAGFKRPACSSCGVAAVSHNPLRRVVAVLQDDVPSHADRCRAGAGVSRPPSTALAMKGRHMSQFRTSTAVLAFLDQPAPSGLLSASSFKLPVCRLLAVELHGAGAGPVWDASHLRPVAKPESDDFAAQDNVAASSFVGEIARDGRARLACDGALYLVQRQRRSGWWRVVASGPDVATLRLAVRPTGGELPGDGPGVRSDVLLAALAALPFAAVDWSGEDGEAVEPVEPVDRVAPSRGRPVGSKDRRKRKPRADRRARGVGVGSPGTPRKRVLVPGKDRADAARNM